jgi:hypothetical protein
MEEEMEMEMGDPEVPDPKEEEVKALSARLKNLEQANANILKQFSRREIGSLGVAPVGATSTSLDDVVKAVKMEGMEKNLVPFLAKNYPEFVEKAFSVRKGLKAL